MDWRSLRNVRVQELITQRPCLHQHSWAFDFEGRRLLNSEGFRFRNKLGRLGKVRSNRKESGVYHFKLFYGAYTKVFLDNKLVVEERWRPS